MQDHPFLRRSGKFLLPHRRNGTSLLAQAQTTNQLYVAVVVGMIQIVQVTTAFADQLEQVAARVLIMCMRLQMLNQGVDALCQQGNLNFRRPGIRFVLVIFLDDY